MLEMKQTEMAVIGRFILDGDSHTNYNLPAEVFTNNELREMYESFADKPSVSVNVLTDRFSESLITAAVQHASPNLSLGAEVAELKAALSRRIAVKALNEAAENITQGGGIGDAMNDALAASASTDDAERTTTMADAMMEYYTKLQTVMDGGEVPSLFIKSGFDRFDEDYGGFASTDLTVIGGRPSMGKTSFALSTALYQAKLGKRILWFSMDASVDQIVCRAFANESKAALKDLKRHKPQHKDMSKVAGSVSTLGDMDFHIDKSPNLTIGKLTSIARKMHAKKPLDVIYVDYLQQIAGGGTEYENVSNASGSLKRLANELQCAVVALVQLNRGIENRTVKTPTMADIRSSGQIEQDAFMILFPYRPERDAQNEREAMELQGKVELVVAKNKDGDVGRMKESGIIFDADHAAYRNDPRSDYHDRY